MKNHTDHSLKALHSYLVKRSVGLGINIPTLLRTYAELEGWIPMSFLRIASCTIDATRGLRGS